MYSKKSIISWFVFTTFVVSFSLLYLDSSLYNGTYFSNISLFSTDFLKNKGNCSKPINITVSDECAGKYIFVQELPRQFNTDLFNNCSILSVWRNMCPFVVNSGFGTKLNDSDQDVMPGSSWFDTNQFTIEPIFHNLMMKRYRCLTNDSSKASAIFVPYYAGLDVSRYLWTHNAKTRDAGSIAMIEFIRQKPEWTKMFGRDHFSVVGRISSDFRRISNRNSDWGNRFLLLPEVRNMTKLLIESSPWSYSDFAVPYPTYFHPSSDSEVYDWQQRMRYQKRPFLFSFAGAPRPWQKGSIRNEIISQCLGSPGKHCEFMKCDLKLNNCEEPRNIMQLFERSVFCLQPPGDSPTRRSAFDSILAGCIPVFFHPGSAYTQYFWHLPKNFSSYSVFIHLEDVRRGNFTIEKRLLEISEQEIKAMRKEVISLIPKVIYASPNSTSKTFEDAFDISVKEVLNRIENIRIEFKQGLNVSYESFPEKLSWKHNLIGGFESHEWDKYFSKWP